MNSKEDQAANNSRDVSRTGFSSGKAGQESTSQQGDTNTGKGPSNGLPAISLPKGGGAIQGMGEKFSMNPVTGTGSMSVPIAVSPGRSGFAPGLGIAYDSGAGNGLFGLGWSLAVPAISRKTDKGLPRYDDANDSDVFLLAGSEDLVPALKNENDDWIRDSFDLDGFHVQRYRPRTEGNFLRIEKWLDGLTGDVFWKTVTPDNMTSLFGKSAEARIVDPDDPRRIFSWLLEETCDDKGNCIIYEYKKEDHENIDPAQPQEGKRLTRDTSFANRHIKRIKYGNTEPFKREQWLFEAIFDYGEHGDSNQDIPAYEEIKSWPVRLDPFSNYRAGFEVRTYRLCHRVLMFHHFEEELGPEPYLVSSTNFKYLPQAHLTKLLAATQTGYLKKEDGTYTQKSLPPVEFTYSEPEIDEEIHSIEPDDLEHLPVGLADPYYQWVDLNGEGLSGVLTQKADAWYYKRNLGDGKFAAMQALPTQPSLNSTRSPQPQIMDVNGDGQKELVLLDEPISGFFERSTELDFSTEQNSGNNWQPFKPFRSMPNINWQDPNLRFVDLTGDGHADILITEDQVFTWYPGEAEKGFSASQYVPKKHDEEQGPNLVFADGTQSIFLADMSGDGLTDLLRIRNGEICYWPNLGYGRFGEKILMENAPLFDHPEQFDLGRIRLTDVDGSGTIDCIYLAKDAVRIYSNHAGNGWSTATELKSFPAIDNLAQVSVLDLLGKGTACLVWSSPLPDVSSRPMRYIDLMGGQKPHLLTRTKNNMGAETRMQYCPSTKFYLQDERDGRPWLTKLPFVVWVVEMMEMREAVTNFKMVTTYKYHDGYFDGVEREFRGFGHVEQYDTESFSGYNGKGLFSEPPEVVDEEFYQPPVLTKSWFHTGAFLGRESISQHYVSDYYQGDDQAILLPDTLLPEDLTTQEEREACRALRGSMLRQEVFSLDNTDKQNHPYSVAENKLHIKVIQPQTDERHAVFYVCGCESLTYHYERNPKDPRISHSHTLEIDAYGNQLKTAAIAYPRRQPAFEEQEKLHVVVAENDVRNLDQNPDFYRLGLPLESRSYEITGLAPKTGGLFGKAELLAALVDPASTITEIAFEDEPKDGKLEKRLLGQTRNQYLKNDLSGALPFGEVDSLALPFKSYQLAFTRKLIVDTFKKRTTVTDDLLLNEGRYEDLDKDGHFWIPSGQVILDPDRFYLPIKAIDQFDTPSFVFYDAHSLLVEFSEDFLGNKETAHYDYRLLAPDVVTDPNGNRGAVAFDELGMVTRSAVMGKENETDPDKMGDTLADPTMRLEYTLFNFMDTGQPNMVHSFAREQHGAANPRFQESYSYSDGLGNEVMTKIQAEPGIAPARDKNGQLLKDENGDLILQDTGEIRWVGNGRTVLDNKGNPVKQYEPFFSSTFAYETEAELVEFGITPILRYDPLGRNIRTDLPDGTFTRVEFDPWQQKSFDPNDNVLNDCRWYSDRNSPDPQGAEPTDAQTRAAWLAAQHAHTPAVVHMDTLGRPFLGIEHNKKAGADEFIPTQTKLDITGNAIEIKDARDKIVATYVHDMLGQQLYINSMDAGEGWSLTDVAGKLLRSWDSRGHQNRARYDELQRPTEMLVLFEKTGIEKVVQNIEYGDSLPDATARNMRGHVFKLCDGAGVVTTDEVDFKGDVLSSTRQVAERYEETLDWSQDPPLMAESFTHKMAFDALGRLTRQTTPDGSIYTPKYNAANFLESENVFLKRSGETTIFIKNINYDAKGQRTLIEYGGRLGTEIDTAVEAHTFTTYEYEPDTFRLSTLVTTRTKDGKILQDLHYTYDPVGNITEIRDNAHQDVYFKKDVVTPKSSYEYDALYRLISATGREHPGQQPRQRDHEEIPTLQGMPHANDPKALTRYTQKYTYDVVGNIEQMKHIGKHSWTRHYRIDEKSNQLHATSLPGDDASEPELFSGKYSYDAHGNMESMPHLPRLPDLLTVPEEDKLPAMNWDYADQLQTLKFTNGETVHYVYDASGERLRKVHTKGNITEERFYLGGFEIYRKHRGTTVETERETLHLVDGEQRIALIETLTKSTPLPGAQQTGKLNKPQLRYQLGNHLGSASIELDEIGKVITYEEYHPYGTSALRSGRSLVEVSLKRYRYIGKERDDESGLYYCAARYYAAWLGRWTAADPAGFVDGINIFRYSKNSPISYKDPDGEDSNKRRRRRRRSKSKPKASFIIGLRNSKLFPWLRGVFETGKGVTTGPEHIPDGSESDKVIAKIKQDAEKEGKRHEAAMKKLKKKDRRSREALARRHKRASARPGQTSSRRPSMRVGSGLMRPGQFKGVGPPAIEGENTNVKNADTVVSIALNFIPVVGRGSSYVYRGARFIDEAWLGGRVSGGVSDVAFNNFARKTVDPEEYPLNYIEDAIMADMPLSPSMKQLIQKGLRRQGKVWPTLSEMPLFVQRKISEDRALQDPRTDSYSFLGRLTEPEAYQRDISIQLHTIIRWNLP